MYFESSCSFKKGDAMISNHVTPRTGSTAKNSFPLVNLHPSIIKKDAPSSFEGAIFDLDGTLIDSMGYWENLGPTYLAARGKTPKPDAARKFKELTFEEAAVYMKEAYQLSESADQIYNDIIGGIDEPYRSLIPLKPGVINLLNALDKAGIRMCIATASKKEQVMPALERLGIRSYFYGIYTCSEVGASKSQPEVFEWAVQEPGTPRASTVVFEDSLHAIKTAKQAGFPVIAVRERSAARDASAIEKIADAVIDSFEDMSAAEA